VNRAFALLLCIAAVWLTTVAVGRESVSERATALALGFALVAAPLAGAAFERLKLPRVSGYLVFGLICGPYVANIITRPMARELRLVNGIAVALIAFVAGLEMNFARLRPQLRTIAGLGGVTLAVMYVAFATLLWIAWPWLPIAPDATGAARFAISAILATLLVSFSPTVTIAVIADLRARGPLSELVLALVVLADLALIFAFTVSVQFARSVFGAEGAEQVGIVVRLVWEILGSFAFGAAVGAAFALYLRSVGRELTLVLLGACLVLSEVAVRLHFEPLLAALAAGLVVENMAASAGDALREAVERGAAPVLVVFFAAAGASLALDALAAVGMLAFVLAAIRLLLLVGATRLGRRLTGAGSPSELAWMGLVSQAGVTLGLTVLIVREFPAWGQPIQTLIVALTGLHVLVGPILFKAALERAGEIGRMDASGS
jgi:Kef-type K+ transport system membrane component KefB